MKVAILGTRGVPPAYGGFETFAGELSVRLVARGHQVTVYCREEGPAEWRGVRCVVRPFVRGKYFETVTHTLASALHAAHEGYDAVLLCNAANAFTIPVLAAARIPVAINVDGIERRRRKWNPLGRAFYAAGEAFSVVFASRVIADANVIAEYYRANYAASPDVISYGAEFPPESDSDVLERLGLRERAYVLYVSRFEPENNPLEVVLAYERCRAEAAGVMPPLVMLGSGLYARGLVEDLYRHRSDSVLFPGALYGAAYRTLQRHALVYVQATEVGGTHPALIEAMASGGCVLANDTPENREVGGDAIRYFALGPGQTLSALLCETLRVDARDEAMRQRTRRRAADLFGWERVTDSYESLLRDVSRGG